GPDPMVTGFDTRNLVQNILKQEKTYSWQILNRKIALKELGVSGSKYNDAMREKNTWGFIKNLLFGNRPLVQTLVQRCPDVIEARSVEELAQRMNQLTGTQDIEAAGLQSAIKVFDEALAGKGEDPQVQRIQELLQYRGDRLRTMRHAQILDPKGGPLMAIREFILTRKSLGGIQTNLHSQVLTPAGSTIPGLYAIGEAAGFGGGGIHGKRALEGTFLGNCIFNARVAVKHLTSA
ncbi:MAG: FAD-binding protein, partial [Bacteroidota bacterium]